MQLLTIFSSFYVMYFALFGGGIPPRDQQTHYLLWHLAAGVVCGRAAASSFLGMVDGE
jgi:hypothetical protein